MPAGWWLLNKKRKKLAGFDPLSYSSTLNLWIDARLEAVQADDSDIVAADQSGTQTVSAGANTPHYRTPASGINGHPVIEGRTVAEAANKGYELGDVDMEGVGGLTVAAIIQADTLHTNQTVISKDDDAVNKSWQLCMPLGGYALEVSGDGTNVVAAESGVRDTNVHAVVGVWEPSTRVTIYVDGVKEDEVTASVPAALHSTTEDTRIMLRKTNNSDPLRGRGILWLSYADALTDAQCLALCAELATLGGV